MEIKLRDFESQILYFNGMYKLPVAPYPTSFQVIKNEKTKKAKAASITMAMGDKEAVIARVKAFHKTLCDEVNEALEIVRWLELGKKEVKDKEGNITGYVDYTELEFLTDMADWLGDNQVYCASEMAKFGIPQKETLRIIMSSNFSKLGPDGNPIYDEHGKVQKGPMYWKPEPQIKAMLQERINEATVKEDHGIVWSGK